MRWWLALAAVVGGVLVAPPSAFGHAILTSASPQTQSSTESAPEEIALEFDQSVTVTDRSIEVLATDGSVLSGPARSETSGRLVVAPVRGLERGSAYTVRWRVTSSDGHSPSGVFTFGIGVPAPPPTAAVGAKGTTWKDDAARWLLFGALALLIGPLAVRLLVLRGPVPGVLEHRFHLVTTAAAISVINVGISCHLPSTESS